jgi:hypothetical protein
MLVPVGMCQPFFKGKVVMEMSMTWLLLCLALTAVTPWLC